MDHRRNGGQRRRLSVRGLVCAAGGALVFGSLAGCGAATGQSSGGESADGEPDYARIEAHADAIYQQIWGTADEKEADHFLTFQALNDPTVNCMGEKGFEFVPTYNPLWSGWVADSTESGGWLGKLDWAPSEPALSQASARTGDPSEDENHTAAYEEAMHACNDAQQPPTLEAGTGVGADELAAAFHGMLDEVNSQLGSIDEYQTCMANHGVDLGDDELGATGLSLYLHSQMPTPPAAGRPASESWANYLEVESRTLATDRTCRAEKYQAALELLSPKLDDFEQAHGSELASAQAAQERILDQAVAAGFSPPPNTGP
jgi:hypothetical protein